MSSFGLYVVIRRLFKYIGCSSHSCSPSAAKARTIVEPVIPLASVGVTAFNQNLILTTQVLKVLSPECSSLHLD